MACLCVVYAHIWGSVHTTMHTCWAQRSMLGALLYHSPHHSPETWSLTDFALSWWWASRRCPLISIPLPLHTQPVQPDHAQLLMWMLGSKLRSSCLYSITLIHGCIFLSHFDLHRRWATILLSVSKWIRLLNQKCGQGHLWESFQAKAQRAGRWGASL